MDSPAAPPETSQLSPVYCIILWRSVIPHVREGKPGVLIGTRQGLD